MTRFRYWLADLISGGELTRVSNRMLQFANRQLDASMDRHDAMDKYYDLRMTLRTIAAEAKPTSNATVRRMARIAQEALK